MGTPKDKIENLGKIVEIVKAYGSEGITVKDVAELAEVSTQTVYNLQPLLADYDISCAPCKHGRRYIYKPDAKQIYRNAEGYVDKTAGNAIMGRTIVTDFKVGGIYEEKYLVLKAFSEMIVYLAVESLEEKGEYVNDVCVHFDFKGRACYVNPHRIWSTSTRKVDVNVCDKIDMGLFKQIVGLCGMNTVEIEKEVEKVVYKDRVVEKAVENEEYLHKIELLEQKAEIWEKAFYAVTGKGA